VLIAPGLLDGILAKAINLRSIGTWETFTNGRSAGSVPQPAGVQVGDLLVVYSWGGSGGGPNESTEWTLRVTHAGLPRRMHSRIATGDSNDIYTAASETSGIWGGYQMAAFEMIGFTDINIELSANVNSYTGAPQNFMFMAFLAAESSPNYTDPTFVLTHTIQAEDPIISPMPTFGLTGTLPWVANTVKDQGVGAAGSSVIDVIFISNNSGTTGSSEPTWNETVGGLTTDNDITWTAFASPHFEEIDTLNLVLDADPDANSSTIHTAWAFRYLDHDSLVYLGYWNKDPPDQAPTYGTTNKYSLTV